MPETKEKAFQWPEGCGGWTGELENRGMGMGWCVRQEAQSSGKSTLGREGETRRDSATRLGEAAGNFFYHFCKDSIRRLVLVLLLPLLLARLRVVTCFCVTQRCRRASSLATPPKPLHIYTQRLAICWLMKIKHVH